MKSEATLSEALLLALDEASRALARDSRGNLERGSRQKIWAALGPRDDVGRRRRVKLAALAVERVLPIWAKAFPGDDEPRRLLALASALLEGRVDPKQARAERETAFSEMDSRSDMRRDKMPVAVGYGAVQTLSAALSDEVFDPAAIDPATKDDDAEPWERDAAYFASSAVAGGPPWDATSDTEARRAFYTWWLREAVPLAFSDSTPTAR